MSVNNFCLLKCVLWGNMIDVITFFPFSSLFFSCSVVSLKNSISRHSVQQSNFQAAAKGRTVATRLFISFQVSVKLLINLE